MAAIDTSRADTYATLRKHILTCMPQTVTGTEPPKLTKKLIKLYIEKNTFGLSIGENTAQLLATGLDYQELVNYIFKNGVEGIRQMTFTTIKDFYPITGFDGTSVKRLVKTTPCERTLASAQLVIWQKRERISRRVNGLLYSLLVFATELLPQILTLIKAIPGTRIVTVVSLMRPQFLGLSSFPFIIKGFEQWEILTNTDYSHTRNGINRHQAEREQA